MDLWITWESVKSLFVRLFVFAVMTLCVLDVDDKNQTVKNSTVKPLLISICLGRVKIRSDNRKAIITGLNGVGRVGLRLDN